MTGRIIWVDKMYNYFVLFYTVSECVEMNKCALKGKCSTFITEPSMLINDVDNWSAAEWTGLYGILIYFVKKRKSDQIQWFCGLRAAPVDISRRVSNLLVPWRLQRIHSLWQVMFFRGLQRATKASEPTLISQDHEQALR